MNEPINMNFTVSELNLILEGLGNMAYYRVHELIHRIQSEAQEQVNSMASVSATIGNNTQAGVRESIGVYAEKREL
jgi:hypothetical protein